VSKNIRNVVVNSTVEQGADDGEYHELYCAVQHREGIRSPAEAKDFSFILCAHTSSEARPASYSMGTGGSFPRGKAWLGRDADHSPRLVPRSRMSRSSLSLRLHGGSGIALLYFTLFYLPAF
jgi:hypothetical protein